MSMEWCDGCGRLVDTDDEEMVGHEGEKFYNSGMICFDCWDARDNKERGD